MENNQDNYDNQPDPVFPILAGPIETLTSILFYVHALSQPDSDPFNTDDNLQALKESASSFCELFAPVCGNKGGKITISKEDLILMYQKTAAWILKMFPDYTPE